LFFKGTLDVTFVKIYIKIIAYFLPVFIIKTDAF